MFTSTMLYPCKRGRSPRNKNSILSLIKKRVKTNMANLTLTGTIPWCSPR